MHHIFLVLVVLEKDTNILTGKCFRSQRRNEEPHQISVSFANDQTTPLIEKAICTCPIGTSAACGHITGLLYQTAKYKILGLKALPEDVAKTSQPQTWHTPRGEKIRGKSVQDLEVSSYKYNTERETVPRTVKSTLYNPVRGENVDWKSKHSELMEVCPSMLMLPSLQNYDMPL